MASAWSRKSLMMRLTERMSITAAFMNTAVQNTAASLSCMALYALLYKKVLRTYRRTSVSSSTIIRTTTAAAASAPRLLRQGLSTCQNSRPKRVRPSRRAARAAASSTPARVCSSHSGEAASSVCHFCVWARMSGDVCMMIRFCLRPSERGVRKRHSRVGGSGLAVFGRVDNQHFGGFYVLKRHLPR